MRGSYSIGGGRINKVRREGVDPMVEGVGEQVVGKG